MIRRVLSPALLLGWLVACAGPERIDDVAGKEEVVIATSSSESEGGIGGTGAPSRDKVLAVGDETEGGIGGTGIFGTVTAFGSIVVNGQTIDIDDAEEPSHTEMIGRDLPLTVGSTVIVEARPDAGGWTANRVSIFLPVVGPVSAIDPAARVVTVMGTRALFDESTVIVDRRGYIDGKVIAPDDIEPGDRLAVSGLWKGGEVIASRIDRLDDKGPDSLRGLLLKTEEMVKLGGTRLDETCCETLAAPSYVQMVGTFADDHFRVDQADVGSTLLFGERVERLIVEAFLARDPDGQGFHLSGFGIPADQSSAIDAQPGVRSLFVGAYDEAFSIQRSIALPGDASARINVFEALNDLAEPD
ncbi:MAG: DUF5666 domain-containing protein [Pseudomonadota bacterium]